jgi:tyrosine-specific transport protein
MSISLYSAIATLIGTIVGAGIFGLPYVVSQSGVWLGAIILIILTIAVTIIHLCYGEISLRTKDSHMLVGYADKYLGPKGKYIATFTLILSVYGSLLAYTILGGEFLASIFSSFIHWEPLTWSIIFYALMSVAIIWGLKTVAKLELFMTAFLFLTILIILFSAGTAIKMPNLLSHNWLYIFLPYGVILYALDGLAAIPELEDIVAKKRDLKKVIIWGTVIPAIIYLLFTLAVVGVSGDLTSPEALKGLTIFLGNKILLVGALFGILAIATSFLTLGLNLKQTFIFDYKFKTWLTIILAVILPLILFLSGLNNFIAIIATVGAVSGSVNAFLIFAIYRRAKLKGDKKPEYSINLKSWLFYSLVVVYLLGFFYQIYYLTIT